MKQTQKFSIGGYAFTFDAEAAAETERYLRDMEAYYSNPEITEGIEERMAELLRERTPEGGVVEKHTILGIIDILARPERIAEDEPESAAPEKPAKKLYRDMEKSKVAGVCSGIGAYFNFDPAILRIAFVALSLAGFIGFADKNGVVSVSVPVLYLILWICIPAARTARQRWELRGDDGSVESIRRNLEKGAGEVGEAIRQVGNSPAWGTAGRVVEVIAGVILLIISVSGLFAGALAVFGWEWLGWTGIMNEISESIHEEIPWAVSIMQTTWVQILVAAVYTLPFIGMLYGSILLLFRIKAPSWRPGLVVFVLWLISLVALTILLLASLAPAEIL